MKKILFLFALLGLGCSRTPEPSKIVTFAHEQHPHEVREVSLTSKPPTCVQVANNSPDGVVYILPSGEDLCLSDGAAVHYALKPSEHVIGAVYSR